MRARADVDSIPPQMISLAEERMIEMQWALFNRTHEQIISARSFEEVTHAVDKASAAFQRIGEMGRTLILAIRKSVIFYVKCPSVKALDDLWHMCESEELAGLLKNFILTMKLLDHSDAKKLSITASIDRDSYESVRDYLLKQSHPNTDPEPSTSSTTGGEVVSENYYYLFAIRMYVYCN